MFTTIFVQPIFNLLALIYALIPGHNFGVAIILFTILVRLLMWPLVKKQLHHAKAMRALAPELKKIKAGAGGDRRKESQLVMELYKEREINPFASLGIVIVQIPILIGLYIGLNKLVHDPQQIVNFSYPALHSLSWMQTLIADIGRFDATLFGWVNLTRPALGEAGFYAPALLIVAAGSISQFYQTRQLMPQSQEARSLRRILSEAGKGRTADQQEVNAAVGRATLYLIPAFVFIIGLNLPSALPLYWLVSSLVALIQQTIILREDVAEVQAIVDEGGASSEVVEPKPESQPEHQQKSGKKRSPRKSKKRNRRRRGR